MKIWEKLKAHPIYSKVIAQLIGFVIIGLIGLIYFKSILKFVRQVWIIPMWGLVLIGIVPCIIMLIAYILYNYKKLIFMEEEGTYKDKNSERRFCIICKSPLQKIDNFWHCNKCNHSFGKKTLVAASCSSPRVTKSKFIEELRRW